MGIIAACIPTVKPLFDKPFRRTRSWNRKLAGEGPDQLRGGDDDRRRLQPALQPDVHLDTLPTGHIPYLGDRGRERNKVEIKAGGQGNREMGAMGLGREEIGMDTEFGTYRGDHEDGFVSVLTCRHARRVGRVYCMKGKSTHTEVAKIGSLLLSHVIISRSNAAISIPTRAILNFASFQVYPEAASERC